MWGGFKSFLIASAWATLAMTVVLVASHLTTWVDRTDASFAFGYVAAAVLYSRRAAQGRL